MTSAPSLVDRIRRLDACSVSDALDAFDMTGVIDGVRPQWACGRVAGRVVTVRLVERTSGQPPASRHLGTTAIEMAEPGDVIVVDNGDRRTVAGWGGLLSLAAHTRGVGGVIIYGACRDVDESAEMRFPVFASAATPRTARNRVVEACTGEPLSLGGVGVATGDFVLADQSGVVVIPAAAALEIVNRAEEIAGREAAYAARLHNTERASAVLGSNYETLLTVHWTAPR